MNLLKLLYGFETTLVVTIENNSFWLFSPTQGGREERRGKTRGKVRRWIEWEEKRGGGRGERGT